LLYKSKAWRDRTAWYISWMEIKSEDRLWKVQAGVLVFSPTPSISLSPPSSDSGERWTIHSLLYQVLPPTSLELDNVYFKRGFGLPSGNGVFRRQKNSFTWSNSEWTVPQCCKFKGSFDRLVTNKCTSKDINKIHRWDSC
jgi:hypothetical protein